MIRFSSRSLPFFLVLFALAGTPAHARKLACDQFPDLMSLILSRHYTEHKLTETLKTRTVEQFIKSVDSSKTVLLEADITRLKAELPKLFETMNNNNCKSLDDLHALLLERVKANEAFVRKFVGPEYKIDESVEFQVDAEKRPYPKTVEDREKMLKVMAHFQMMNLQISEPSLEKAKKQLIHRYELATKRYAEQSPADLIGVFAESFARSLDPHSSYLTQDSMEDFQISMNLSLDGIGVSLSSEDGYIVVQEIIPGGSADKAKALQPKDKIMAVGQGTDGDSVSVVDMDLREVVKKIRGKKGTKVKLTVLRQKDKAQTLEIVLVRDKVDIQEQAAHIDYRNVTIKGKKQEIAILDLPSFYGGADEGGRSSYRDMKKLLDAPRTKKAAGMILDLSRNGGGLLQEAVKITGLFIRKGPVVATQNTQKQKQVLADENKETEFRGPLILLTSRVSASASEILAGALKDYRRALVVGADHTFGKGTVQELSMLPLELGGIKLTMGMYFVPSGQTTQNQGVAADVTLPSVWGAKEVGESTLDYALAPEHIDVFLSTEANSAKPGEGWLAVTPELAKRLSDKSKKRVEKDKEFQDIVKELQETEKNKGVIKLAELKQKSQTEKKKEDKEKRKTAEGRRQSNLDTPYTKETINVLTDWLSEG